MSENMSDYIPPDGWRVKGDDEVVEKGDKYSHDALTGMPSCFEELCRSSVGMTSKQAVAEFVSGNGYILTPIVSPATPQLDVSQEQQTDDRSPLDIHLPEIERKINLASKDNPALLKWWRAEKERLAIEAGKRMGGGL